MARHPQHARALTALVALTTVWGSTFVVVQSTLVRVSPFVLMALRFGLAGGMLALLRPAAARQALSIVSTSLPLSLSMFLGFALQTLGLRETTPARSAFLTSLSVVLVPLVEFVATRRWPKARMLAAVALATGGVAVLFHPIGLEWRRGDTLTLLCTGAFAFYLVELGAMARRHGALALVIAQFVTIAAIAVVCAVTLETPRFSGTPGSYLSLAYLTLVCTVLTFLLMTWAQARVEPIEAGIIYTLEPLAAAIFSIALGRELLSWKVVAGGALILGGMAIAGTAPTVTPPGPMEGID